MSAATLFPIAFAALYVGHHVGDYWVQTDEQAAHKGDEGIRGELHCVAHVLSYLITQMVCVWLAFVVCGVQEVNGFAMQGGFAVSGITHYLADRREYGLMFWLARKLPGKARFLDLGVPRAGHDDNPSLGTGRWALDQSWHLFFGVFLAALVISVGAR